MTNPPVFPFFVGRGRSGTTLLRAMFDSHPDTAVPPESHFVPSLGLRRSRFETANGFDSSAFIDAIVDRRGFRDWAMSRRELHEALVSSAPSSYPDAVRRVFSLYAHREGKERYADKTPIYVLHLKTLAELFPEARFVHIIRDGRNVALSLLEARLRPESLEESALLWKRFVQAGREAGAELGPGRYREIRYEDLVDDTEPCIRELCAFLGLPFDERMLRYHERAEAIIGRAAHHQNLRRPPTRGLRDWKREMSQHDIALFEALAGDLLSELGYDRATTRPRVTVWITSQGRRLQAEARRLKRRSRKIIRRLVPRR